MSLKALQKIRWNDERTIFVALFLALIAFGALLSYTALNPPQQAGFVSLYVLDDNKMAINYPQSFVIGKNNTLSLWVGVGNFMGETQRCSVLVKVVNGTVQAEPVPVDSVKSYEKILPDRETWEFSMTMTLNQTGKYRVFLELWLSKEPTGFVYSGSNSIGVDVTES